MKPPQTVAVRSVPQAIRDELWFCSKKDCEQGRCLHNRYQRPNLLKAVRRLVLREVASRAGKRKGK